MPKLTPNNGPALKHLLRRANVTLSPLGDAVADTYEGVTENGWTDEQLADLEAAGGELMMLKSIACMAYDAWSEDYITCQNQRGGL